VVGFNMSSHRELNAHEAPPASIKEIFKRYQKIKLAELDSDKGIIIVSSPDPSEGLEVVDEISGSQLSSLFSEFCDERVTSEGQLVYHHTGLPGRMESLHLFSPFTPKLRSYDTVYCSRPDCGVRTSHPAMLGTIVCSKVPAFSFTPSRSVG
jgi:hypothetical protein